MSRRNNRPSPEQQLIDYYQSEQLGSDRLHAIIDETQTTNRNRYVGFALAASLALMAVFTALHQNLLASHRTDTVLREAALNHSSKLQMDAETGSLSELQNELGELKFDIKLPKSDFFGQLALVGGRYCTISGNLAAHLKLSNPETSEQFSLFLTPYAKNLKTMESSAVEISGVDVELWHEDNVVYALATGISR